MQGSEEMSAWRQNRMPKDGKVRKKRADGPRRPNPLTTNPAPREYSKSPLLETPQPAQQLVSPLMADNEGPAPARGPGAIYKHVLPQGQAPAAQQEGKYFMDPNKTVVKPSPLETGSGYYGRGGGGGSARPNQRPSSRPTSPESRAPGSSRSAPPRAGAGYGNYQPPAGGGRLGGNSPGYGSINQTPPNAAGRRTGRRRRGGSGDDAEGDLEEALREGALKEQADCRLETMTRVPTTLVLLAPYLAFALAMWLDTSTALQRTQLPLTLSDCSAPGLSCSLAPGGGGGGTTVWTAQVDGVPPAGSFLYLDAVFPSGSPALSDAAIASAKSGGAEGSTYYQMPLSVKVWGLDGSEATSASGSGDGTDDADSGGSDGAGGAGMGAVIYDAPEDTETFQCTATEEACAPVRVVDLLLNSPGAAGWYAGYTVALEYEDGLGDLFAGARFTLSYTSAFWADLTKYARAGALALALAAAVNWLVQNGAEPKERNTWLPERQYFTALLLFLLLWLNPWRCWAEWAGGRVPGDLRAWLLATDLAQGLGTQGLFLSALLVMDGLRFVKKKHRGPSYMDQLGLVSDVPPHHPCGDDACDFFWVKVAYFAAAAAATTACALARHWDLLDGRPKAAAAADEVDAVAGAYLALTALTLAFALGWLLWTLRATVRTGLVLRRRPFLDNRFQQLLYRVLSAQGALVGVALGVSYGVQIYGTFRYSLGNLNLALLPQVWLGQTGLETLWGSGPGQLLFLAVVAATLQYIMLPPDHSVRRANNRMFVAMERQLPRAALRQRRRPTLCLETALNLMEASWQVYYDHTGYSHNPIAPGRMELDELGLRLEAVFEDAAQDVRGFLARAEDPPRLVLAFRGTMTLKNVLTDLDLGQMLLYDVMEPPEELRGHGWGAEEDSEASYHSESDDDWGGSPRGSYDAAAALGAARRGAAATRRRRGRGRCARLLRRVANAVPCLRPTVPRVHVGFAQAYRPVRAHVLRAVRRAQTERYAPLYVTGHSLGASIAALAAYDIASHADFGDNIVFYSFGMPRLGNARFARMFNKKVPHHFRVTVDGDAVPGQPSFFYRHSGTRVLVDADYGGRVVVNPSIVEKTFGTKGHTNISAHSLSRYRDCLEAALDQDELQEYLSKGLQRSKGRADPDAVPEWLLAARGGGGGRVGRNRRGARDPFYNNDDSVCAVS